MYYARLMKYCAKFGRVNGRKQVRSDSWQCAGQQRHVAAVYDNLLWPGEITAPAAAYCCWLLLPAAGLHRTRSVPSAQLAKKNLPHNSTSRLSRKLERNSLARLGHEAAGRRQATASRTSNS
ncbi:hypothetical protein E2C01_017678 [Portunus trituberculatus]|uniref:Uncharacterized protein n=1 Tax=Portunus trituberculatus TaxID=210409 RepID=A0A5B7DSG2_PORTR|nr:hypothetical protein [Portunus trituberculatus]